MIDLKDVRKHYRSGNLKSEVLRGVNLQVKQGEYVAIMGNPVLGKVRC